MTNNTKMVLVPRELLERIFSGCMFTLSSKHYDELRTLLAAPAEDVHAVVDEPVAETYPDAHHSSVMALHDVMQAVPCSSLYSLAEAVLDAGYTKTNQQRPAVMLMRKPVLVGLDSESNSQNKGWNDCIDEFERLNK